MSGRRNCFGSSQVMLDRLGHRGADRDGILGAAIFLSDKDLIVESMGN